MGDVDYQRGNGSASHAGEWGIVVSKTIYDTTDNRGAGMADITVKRNRMEHHVRGGGCQLMLLTVRREGALCRDV